MAQCQAEISRMPDNQIWTVGYQLVAFLNRQIICKMLSQGFVTGDTDKRSKENQGGTDDGKRSSAEMECRRLGWTQEGDNTEGQGTCWDELWEKDDEGFCNSKGPYV
jgi:hypothetical protein